MGLIIFLVIFSPRGGQFLPAGPVGGGGHTKSKVPAAILGNCWGFQGFSQLCSQPGAALPGFAQVLAQQVKNAELGKLPGSSGWQNRREDVDGVWDALGIPGSSGLCCAPVSSSQKFTIPGARRSQDQG